LYSASNRSASSHIPVPSFHAEVRRPAWSVRERLASSRAPRERTILLSLNEWSRPGLRKENPSTQQHQGLVPGRSARRSSETPR
jgi:hypothetical protein